MDPCVLLIEVHPLLSCLLLSQACRKLSWIGLMWGERLYFGWGCRYGLLIFLARWPGWVFVWWGYPISYLMLPHLGEILYPKLSMSRLEGMLVLGLCQNFPKIHLGLWLHILRQRPISPLNQSRQFHMSSCQQVFAGLLVLCDTDS